MSHATLARPVGVRAHWMDSLRGVAIVLVLCWHSAAILLLFDIDVPTWLIVVNNSLAPYRMPILMTLSGMLLRRSLSKPAGVYAWGKIAAILWPLLVWTAVNYFVVGYDVPIWSREVWGKSYLWFLYYLVVFYAVAPFLRRVPTWILVVLPWLATVAAPTDDSRRFLFLAGFFFLGRLVDERRDSVERLLTGRLPWIAASIALLFSAAFVIWGPWRYQGLLAPLSIAGMIGIVAIIRSRWVGERSMALRWTGRNSVVFYVTHFPVIVGVVMLAEALALPVTVTVVAGLAAALLVGWAMARLRHVSPPVAWLFELPRVDTSTVDRRLQAVLARVGWLHRPVVSFVSGAFGLLALGVVAFELT